TASGAIGPSSSARAASSSRAIPVTRSVRRASRAVTRVSGVDAAEELIGRKSFLGACRSSHAALGTACPGRLALTHHRPPFLRRALPPQGAPVPTARSFSPQGSPLRKGHPMTTDITPTGHGQTLHDPLDAAEVLARSRLSLHRVPVDRLILSAAGDGPSMLTSSSLRDMMCVGGEADLVRHLEIIGRRGAREVHALLV